MMSKGVLVLVTLISSFALETGAVTRGSVDGLSEYQLGQKILNRYIRLQSTAQNKWEYNWTNGVALYGTNKFLRSSQISEDPAVQENAQIYIKKISDVLDLQVSRGLPEVTAPDLVAMSLGALSFYQINENCSSCDDIVENTKTYFKTEPLNSIGAYDHVGKRYRISDLPFPPRLLLGSCIFIDSAMAYILEGVVISIRQNNPQGLEFFLNQFDLFHHYLFEASSGLYKQAYYPSYGRKDPANWVWSRGNMYMAMGLLDTLEVLPQSNPHYGKLKNRLNRLLVSVVKHLDVKNGLKTLTNDPSSDNYFESSSSALLVYNILKAGRLGLLEKPEMLETARELGHNLKKYLVLETPEEISVNQVSGATTAFYLDWYYKHIIRPSKDKTTGIGLYLLMLSETMRLPKK